MYSQPILVPPLVVISDGVEIWVPLGCSKSFFFHYYISTPALALGQFPSLNAR